MVVWLGGRGMEYKWMKKQSKEDEVIIDGPMTLSGSFAPLSELLKKKNFPFLFVCYSRRRRRRAWCNNSIKNTKREMEKTNSSCA